MHILTDGKSGHERLILDPRRQAHPIGSWFALLAANRMQLSLLIPRKPEEIA
jgi:hypothetical protein